MITRIFTIGGVISNLMYACLVGFIVLLPIGGDLLYPSSEQAFLVRNALVVIATLLTGYLIYRNYKQRSSIKRRGEQWLHYCDNYKLAYEQTTTKELRSPTFQQLEQRDATIENSLSGEDWEYGELKYYQYRRAKQSDYRSAMVYYSIVRLELGRDLPHMFFDHIKARGQQFHWKLDAKQIASLEGDFDDHFITYFPEGYRIDARSIISPEVMMAMTEAPISDIEIYKNHIYLYSGLMPVEKTGEFIEAGKKIRQQLMDHSQYYLDKLATTKATKAVSDYGISLNERHDFPWLAILSLIVLILMPIYSPILRDDPRNYSVFIVVLLAYIFYTAFIWYKAKTALKTKREKLSRAVIDRDQTYVNEP